MFKFNIYLKMVLTFSLIILLSMLSFFITLKSFSEVRSLTEEIDQNLVSVGVLMEQNTILNHVYQLTNELEFDNTKNVVFKNYNYHRSNLSNFNFEFCLVDGCEKYQDKISDLNLLIYNLDDEIQKDTFSDEIVLSLKEQLLEIITEIIDMNLEIQEEIVDVQSNLYSTQEDFYNILIKDLIVINIAVIIFGVLVSLSLSKYIVTTINKIKDFIIDIDKGNFDAKINVDTNDELEDLANLADDMRKDIKALNEGLEKKVLQRTKELKQANLEIVKMLKLKSNFLNQVAHDIRTPITAIALSLNLIDAPKDPKNKKNFKIIKNNMKYLTELVNDVLNISRIDAGKVQFNQERHDIKKIVKQVFSNYTNIFKKEGIKTEINIPFGLPSVFVDDAKISEVLQNFVSNSVKYLKGTKNPKITISAKRKKGFIEVQFKDNGKGVEKKHLDKLFEEFYKADESGHDLNAGLGLSITQRIIEKHGGHITAKSSGVGQGFTIIFSLPIKKIDAKKTKTTLEKSIETADNAQKLSTKPEDVLKNVSPELRKKMKLFQKMKEDDGKSNVIENSPVVKDIKDKTNQATKIMKNISKDILKKKKTNTKKIIPKISENVLKLKSNKQVNKKSKSKR
jgi:signal transduction histidine kinase